MLTKFRRKQLCWLCDHPPSLEQRKYLEDRDWFIVEIRSPFPGRWKNAASAYNSMMRECSPSAVVMVLPSSTLGGEFVQLCGAIPVYMAVMERGTDFWEWSGQWEKILGTKYKKRLEAIPYAFGETENA